MTPDGRQRIGDPVVRKEDERLITGRGTYADDIPVENVAFAFFVRSPHAHARIKAIDVAAARAMPGVLAVLTAADAEADGLKPIPHPTGTSKQGNDVALLNRDGTERLTTAHYPLAGDVVRFVGEAIVMVVAETLAAAKDAAESVVISYEVLPAVTATPQAAAGKAPQLWDSVPGNVPLDADVGDPVATEAAFAHAAHRVRLDTWVQRVTGVHMEPRASLAFFDEASGRYTVHCSGGIGPIRVREEIALTLGVPVEAVRLIAPRDVGGNFGTRNATHPEFALLPWAARRLKRPVKHVSDRNESFLSDFQARDLYVEAELALDDKGNFLALRTQNVSNIGAHTVSFVALNKGCNLMSSVYRIPAVHVHARAVMSNTPSTIPYRSAGRPEAMFVIERIIDVAARQCGFDRVTLRKRNLIPEKAFPFTNPVGIVYDNGTYAAAMERALELADWDGFAKRKRAARRQGRYLGIGVANYVETASGMPRERADVRVHPDRRVTVVLGTQPSGQGHETSFSQLIAEWLGVPFESVEIITGDTDVVKAGGGTHSGRSLRYASLVMHAASGEIIAKGKEIAAALLEAASADIEFTDGRFKVAGTDRSVGIFDVAAAAENDAALPAALRGPLAATSDKMVGTLAFPFGAHVCEVEVDPATGTVDILRYIAVDDVGRAVNPLIIHGQTHGGIATGLGQALMEHCVYDPDSGQMLSASLMDYALLRADDLPAFVTELSEVPAASHPLGFRPGGEGGTTPALAAAVNAIVDALADFGVTHIDMPATPQRVWGAIEDARGKH